MKHDPSRKRLLSSDDLAQNNSFKRQSMHHGEFEQEVTTAHPGLSDISRESLDYGNEPLSSDSEPRGNSPVGNAATSVPSNYTFPKGSNLQFLSSPLDEIHPMNWEDATARGGYLEICYGMVSNYVIFE
jgi:hypothetical protein